ncbi:ATP-dependent DNA helicase [Haloimpatiens lingqiaonensis]|uniref:ATP-dependent DNA helicase n=1 Tax=Haloimpatiens lingqiaonensis TaxID=1380675 RepID=UPI0010FD6C03|nr:ATP-dependent DNA helicase [Haloimpatiens lingqiaonensis]
MAGSDIIKVSVRDLVEFLYRTGDLVSSFKGASRNLDAIKIHQKIQKKGGENYNKEFYLCHTSDIDGIKIEISGRADGVIILENEVIIDEIKTTTRPIDEIYEDYNLAHWAQAKCYGFIYADENSLSSLKIQLTYYSFIDEDIKTFIKEFSFEELKDFFHEMLNRYLKYAKMRQDWESVRDNSIRDFKFPFGNYRKGQREFAIGVYKTLQKGKKLFAEAPTGTGKTLATLFPSIKGMGEGICSKIFYLTAKNMGKIAAENTMDYMLEHGLKIKTVSLTSKEKICFKDKNCDPDVCPYAKGHYDRVADALEEIFQKENLINDEKIKIYAEKYQVCPFEFSLDLCNWADCIICDYNYVFDPRVYLRRFFDSYNDYVILVDEAHNLVDRSREMYSAELSKRDMMNLKKIVKEKIPDLYKNLNKINSFFLKNKKEIEGEYYINKSLPEGIHSLTRKFLNICDKWLSREEDWEFKDELLEVYFNVNRFCKVCEWYGEQYVSYFKKQKDDIVLKLFCLDPSKFIESFGKVVKSTIFFSATLAPMDYYMNVLNGDGESYKLRLKSPFPEKNLCLIIDNKISTKYSQRKFTYDQVVQDIYQVIKSKKGNYLIFAPSYEYMEILYQKFMDLNLEVQCIKQEYSMEEEEKEKFLGNFTEGKDETLVGFVVMGGMFGEGIDLTGDKLIGAVVVGVGMPQICVERDLIRNYYDEKNSKGFQYSYIYPGMNKVMQASGRVIRKETDKGAVLLIDTRFGTGAYKSLFPKHWHAKFKSNQEDIIKSLKEFWDSK